MLVCLSSCLFSFVCQCLIVLVGCVCIWLVAIFIVRVGLVSNAVTGVLNLMCLMWSCLLDATCCACV